MSFDTIKPRRAVKVKRRHYDADSIYVPQGVEIRPSRKLTSTKRISAGIFLFLAMQMLSPFVSFGAADVVVESMVPDYSTTNVAINTTVTLDFSKTPDAGANLDLVKLMEVVGSGPDTQVATVNTIDGVDNTKLVVTPGASLDYSTQYYITIDALMTFNTGADTITAAWTEANYDSHDFTTVADPVTVPPVWSSGYPKADTITASGFTVRAETNESGNIYYAVLANNAVAPDVAAIKAGSGFLASGTFVMTADVEGNAVVSTLEDDTDYDVYVLAEDADLNTTLSTKVDVTTLDETAPILSPVSATRSTNTAGEIVFSTDEAGSYYYEIVASGTTPAPTVDTSGSGTAATQGNNTIALTLTTGSHDVYIAVKDAAGNVSEQLLVTVDAKTYTVSFDTDGGSAVPSQTIEHDAVVVEPVTDPTKAGFGFVAWFSDSLLTTLWDFANDVITGPVTIFAGWIDTEDPTVSITAPTAGSNITSGTTTITADASDNVGVEKVEFYKNSVKIGEDTTAPYSLSWNTLVVTNGQYSLTAKAFDEYNFATSTAINVTVTNPDITSADNEIEKEGAKIVFGTMPSNLEGGFDITVAKIALGDRVNPVGKLNSIIYSITPSKTLNGTYSATITLNYPSGRVWKEGDTVMYWAGNSWSTEGIVVTGHTENSLTFTTTHFTDFGVFGNAPTGTGATELPRTGLSAVSIAKVLLNLMLSLGIVLFAARISKKSKLGYILN